jgi:hypothetical protein
MPPFDKKLVTAGKGVLVSLSQPHANGVRNAEQVVEMEHQTATSAYLDPAAELLFLEDAKGNLIACYQWSLVNTVQALDARGVHTNGGHHASNLATGS